MQPFFSMYCFPHLKILIATVQKDEWMRFISLAD